MRLSKKYSVTAVLAAGLAAVVLAACGGGDSGGGNASTMSASGGVVSVKSVDNTDVLTDSQGKTLYTSNVEKGGRILCTSGCTSFWKPLDASASQAKTAASDLNVKLGVVKRPDGTDQLTFGGKPLYSFAEEGAGQMKGDGFVDDFNGAHFEWTAAAANGAQASSGSGSGSSSGSGSGYGY